MTTPWDTTSQNVIEHIQYICIFRILCMLYIYMYIYYMYDFRLSFRKFVKGSKLEFEILRVWGGGANTPSPMKP